MVPSFLFPLLIFLTAAAQASPTANPSSLHIPLTRRSGHRPKQGEEIGPWAKKLGQWLHDKWDHGEGGLSRRASGGVPLVNQNTDASYYGSVGIGTPLVSYNLILDTGSSDLWVASSDCLQGCGDVPAYNPRQSSTFRNASRAFQIKYGSGAATGHIATDAVQCGGFQVNNQVFAVVDRVTTGLLDDPVSGLMGLGFQSIASTRGVPFWQRLATTKGIWDQPLMTFFFTRFQDKSEARDLEPGGRFTMGTLDQSLYEGEIDFVSIPRGSETYWLIPMTQLIVNGNAVTLPTGSAANAAIDTGTTLVAGPRALISELFARIPGSERGVGDLAGYWTYPCDSPVVIQMSFGGRLWDIDPADFMLTELSGGLCLGAFFELEIGGSAPQWIVGDTFLKNVFSVFRYSPPSVGFANLSATARAASQLGSPLPSPSLTAAPIMVNSAQSGPVVIALAISLAAAIASFASIHSWW